MKSDIYSGLCDNKPSLAVSLGPGGWERTLLPPQKTRAKMTRALIKNLVLNRMAEDDFAALEPFLYRVDLKLHQVLLAPNTVIERVYFPESGICSTIAGSDTSESIEVGLIGFEGMTDHVLEIGDQADLCSFVQSPGSALAVDAVAYANWIRERPSALRQALRYAHYFITQISYTALSHGGYKIEERLARWLLMSFDRSEGAPLPLVHNFIGKMLSVRRSGVTTALHALEGDQGIRATRGLIQLRNRDVLLSMAGDSYGAPEREYERLFGPIRAPAD